MRVCRGFHPEWGRLISLVSSMETIFQDGFSRDASELRSVVLPVAVAPETTTKPFRSSSIQRYAATSALRVPVLTSSEMEKGSALCFLMLKLLPRLVTSRPQVAASLNPSGSTESTIGEYAEMDLPDLWTSRETIESMASRSWKVTLVSSHPFEFILLCQILTGLSAPSQETSSISPSRRRGSRIQ